MDNDASNIIHEGYLLISELHEVTGQSDFEAVATFFGITLQYRPVVDLLERLNDLARLAAEHVDELPGLPEFLDQRVTNSALQYLRGKGLRRQGVGRGGNPATGLLEKSPVASAVMQAADQRCKPIYDGVCILLMLHCAEQNSPSAGYDASREIRLSARAVDSRNILLSKLPALCAETEDYLSTIRTEVKNLETHNVVEGQQKLLYVLQNLANLERKRTQPSRSKNDFSTVITESKRPIIEDDVKPQGQIKKLYEASIVHEEPPNRVTVFEADAEVERDPIIFDFASRKAKSWVQKSETLSRVDTTTLNELEKKQLIEQLELQVEKGFDESVIGFAIALIYLLGLELDQIINTRWGANGFIDLQGRVIKALPKSPKIFRSAHNSVESSTCSLPLPSLLRSWIEQHVQMLIGSDSLLAATGEAEKDFISKLHSLLSKWRLNGRYRFKLSKLTAALSAELTYQTRDPLLITAIAGDLKTEPPVLMYYRHLGEDELRHAYQKATNSLLNIPGDLLGFDFGSSPENPKSVKGLIEGMSTNLKNALKHYPADIISSHNALMHFTLAMMMFATGHRPVRDPFCYWDDFDIDDDGVLISDKVVSPRHEYRYQVIPELARAQLNTYRRHLKQLGARLYRDKSLKRQHIGVAIMSCLEGSSKQLPIFFELDEAGLKYLPVTQKSLQDYWQRFSAVPVNAGRSVMCQLLVDRRVQPGIVESYLGHIHGLSHRHGQRAGHAPAVDFAIMAKEIDQAMKKLGWKHINPYKQNRERIRLPKNFKHQLMSTQSKSVFGPEKRRLKRLQRENQIKMIVACARTDIFNDVDSRRLQDEQVNEFFRRVKRDCHHAGLSIQSGVNLASRWLAHVSRRGVTVEAFRAVRELPAESSVISRSIFHDWQQCKKLRASLLAEFSNRRRLESIEQALAELVVMAAVFGGLAKPEALKMLPERIFIDAYRAGGQDVILELKELRWLPDALTLSRIIYIRKHYTIEQVHTDLKRLDTHLSRYLRGHGLKCTRDNVYTRLAELAQALNAWHMPGVLHLYWVQKTEGRHLPLHRFTALLTDKPYLPNSNSEKIVDEEASQWLPALSITESKCVTATQCWRNIKSIFAQVEQSLPVGVEKRGRALRTKLAKQLQDYAQQDEVSVTGKILIAWLVARCRSGVAKENLAFSTITRYASEIVYPILALAGSDLRSFDEDAFEALYLECLESCDSDKAYRLGRLYDFHQFIQTHLSLSTINWSALYALAGLEDSTPSVDANVLTVKEYDRAIQTINDEKGLTPWLKARYMVALMLGYRFGLRFGEALKLRLIDVQRDGNKVFLQLRGSVFGDMKTRAGVRQIPLIGQLSELEKKAWETVTVKTDHWVQKDHQTLLLFDGESPRTSIDKQQAQDYLNKLLKYVSSDNSLRFHHLRHSFANRLMAYAYILPDQLWQQVSRRLIGRFGTQHLPLLWSSQDEPTIKLQAIADVMGHTSIRTTVSSYFHFPEILGRAICNQYKLSLTPKIMAYLLGQNETTLQKRRERSKSKNTLQTYFAGEPVKKLFPLLKTQFQSVLQSEEWWYDFAPESQPISLMMIDRILVQSARMQHSTSCLSSNSNYPSAVIEKVLRNASIVKAQTRFSFYQIPLVDPDTIGGDETGNDRIFQENVLEAKRLNLLLSEVDKKIAEIATIGDESLSKCLQSDLAVWQVDGRYGKSWRFSRESSLSAFIELLAFLPVNDATFKLIHPAGHPLSAELNTQLQSHPALFEITADKQMQKDAVLNVAALPPHWKTVQTVNRVLFCLLVWWAVKLDAIPD